MAGKISAKGAVITLDNSAGSPQNISTGVTSYEIQWAIESHDVTGFSDGWKNNIAGQAIAGVTLNCLWDSTATVGTWTVIRPIIGHATANTLSITPESGGLAFSGEFLCTGVTVSGSADGSPIQMGAVQFVPKGVTIATWA